MFYNIRESNVSITVWLFCTQRTSSLDFKHTFSLKKGTFDSFLTNEYLKKTFL